MSLPPIVRATIDHARTAAELIATAFANLPQVAWLVPEPADRYRILAGNVQIFVDHAIEFGQVHLFGDGSGVAVWFDYTAGPIPAPYRYDDRLAAVCAPYTARFQVLDALFAAHHPHGPHHHLAFLAVHPDKQHRGFGAALLEHHHTRLDQQGVSAYLQASTTGSRDLYARHGYQPAGEPLHLPDRTAPFWPMWRHPAEPATNNRPRARAVREVR